MRGFVGLGIAVLACGACGDNRAPGGGAISGSRLRARYLAHGDARLFLGFHDVERDEDCTYVRTAGSDEAVCLPTYGSIAAYADADCGTPVMSVWGETCATIPRYIATFAGASCTTTIDQVWEVDLSSVVTTLYVSTPDGCFQATGQEGYRYHPARRALSLDTFVRAEVTIEDGDARLRDRYLAGEDGSRLSIGAYDAALEVDCFLDQAYADPTTCVPETFDGGWSWRDSACSDPVIEAYDWCGDEPPRFGVMWSNDRGPAFGECWTRRVHALGDTVELDEVYFGIGTCSVEDAVGTYYTLGDELVGDQLVRGARTLGGGDGRISVYYLQAGDQHDATTRLRDRELGVDCDVQPTPDGAMRCLPVAGNDASYLFADDSCTTRADAASFLGDSCTGVWPDPRFSLRWDYTDCVSTARVHAVGAELAPGSLYTTDDVGACVPYVWDTSWQRIYEQLAEVPITSFARFDEILE